MGIYVLRGYGTSLGSYEILERTNREKPLTLFKTGTKLDSSRSLTARSCEIRCMLSACRSESPRSTTQFSREVLRPNDSGL